MIRTPEFKLLQVNTEADIPADFLGTPFEDILRYHNLGAPERKEYQTAELLVLMCMDHRKKLSLPERFAYIVRNAGANIRSNEFSMAYAIGVGGVEYVAMIAHTDCGMVGLDQKQERFIEGMIEHAGWTPGQAESFFYSNASTFTMSDPSLFIKLEAERFQSSYPRIRFQPFLFDVADGKLYVVQESK